jgi:hypothetical protein
MVMSTPFTSKCHELEVIFTKISYVGVEGLFFKKT